MRSHVQIIADAGGPAAVNRKLAGLRLARPTVFAWHQRGSIPAKRWRAVVDAGLATLEELAEGAQVPHEPKAARLAPGEPVDDRSGRAFRKFMLRSPWADIEIELPERKGGERDIGFLFED